MAIPRIITIALLLFVSSLAVCGSSSASDVPSPRNGSQDAQSTAGQQMPTEEQQIAAATLALPEAFRAEAGVQSISADLKITQLRKGTGSMVCSIIQPGAKNFLAYCQDRVYDAYFYRQSQLQAELSRNGKPPAGADLKAALQKEIESGRIEAPTRPAVGFMMGGPARAFDWNTNTPSREVKHWETIQIPNATGASLSLPNSRPANGGPWVMAEGTLGAHIMIEH
ncbi:MAG TPA: hypothetical protein VED45_03485 [Steroidobacteraceae bacterium]|nr:hypothetical protein [Steroidobacteraceae bacterium]